VRFNLCFLNFNEQKQTGFIFATEVAQTGILDITALVPCLIAAFTSDGIARYLLRLLKADHYNYTNLSKFFVKLHEMDLTETLELAGQTVLASLLFGFTASLFIYFQQFLKRIYKEILFREPLSKKLCGIPFGIVRSVGKGIVGGGVIIILFLIFGSDYLGIGVDSSLQSCDDLAGHPVSLQSCFCNGGAMPFSFLLKLVFTVVTVGSGFKGGEVTPLFFIGAALGNAIADVFKFGRHGFFASLGFVGKF